MNVRIAIGTVKDLLGDGQTTNATGSAVYKDAYYGYVQAHIAGTGAVSATVTIYGSNDGTIWSKTALATISLTGTTIDTEGAAVNASCKFIRAVISSISGTDATVTATLGL